VSLVEHDIFRLPEHMSLLPVYTGVRVTRCTDSNYPFGIVNLFFHIFSTTYIVTLWTFTNFSWL